MLTNTIIKVKGLEKSFELKKVLDGIDFDIKAGERIGLVGYNGTGKTTLANILFGKLAPDKGVIDKPDYLRIGYLSQSIDYEVNDFKNSLAVASDHELYQIASQLGLRKVNKWEQQRLAHLSGGEKLKLALSMVWASKPDFLILDEPTNHIDYQGLQWLVKELKKFNGPVLLISHDRHFLNQTVTRIFELDNGRIKFFNGNYSAYKEDKQKQIEAQSHQYQIQQRQIENIEKQMQQLKSWSEKAHRDSTKKGNGPTKRPEGFKEYHRVKAKKLDNQVKSKMKRLENELSKNKIEKPEDEVKVRFEFENHGKRGKRILEAKQLTKVFPGRPLFLSSNFYVNHGERIGLVGANGCGKTTLIKMIHGEETSSDGELWRSESIKMAYLSQDVNDLPADKNVLEALGFTDRERIYKARTILANLGLKETQILKPIGVLSLGERTRVKLADILMKDYDVLILDEPTNHLDLPSREQLENTLAEFSGTILTVSHDYYFLTKLCNRLLVFENQKVTRLEMTAEEYFNNKQANSRDNKKEALMVIENKITAILGELSLTDSKDPKYAELDLEFAKLLKEKKQLLS
ncbi:ribosomal protection-like ABC-F family protein [Neobacillus dielmonensis]|uniref:ribosomal protection-like ABC-F family protein n=1 Tax=Neobacillus dielmonensis TaxID=1347369 RepID=UPI0005A6DC14|nr:ABC-F type ribosomal protection protein [Neobacillus dielmonensis]